MAAGPDLEAVRSTVQARIVDVRALLQALGVPFEDLEEHGQLRHLVRHHRA